MPVRIESVQPSHTMASKTTLPLESVLTRAIWASPLLIFTAIAIKGMDVGFIIPQLESMREAGQFEVNGHQTPIYSTLLNTGFSFENLIGILSTFFTHMISGFDPISYYQSFPFIIDFAGIYAIMLLESARPYNFWTPAAM
jgi:hypothetical protein